MKFVYFATGTPAEVAADLKRLSLNEDGASLRVVVHAGIAWQLEERASLRPEEVLPYRPFSTLVLWLRLWKFLGLSPHAEIVCLSTRQRFRFLKFLALTLRGRVTFSAGNGTRVSCSLGRLLWGLAAAGSDREGAGLRRRIGFRILLASYCCQRAPPLSGRAPPRRTSAIAREFCGWLVRLLRLGGAANAFYLPPALAAMRRQKTLSESDPGLDE